MRSSVAISAIAFAACTTGEVAQEQDSARSDSTAAVAMIDSGAPKLLPRDEANASFREFRSGTLRALARKDTAFLYGMLVPEIKISLGPEDGIAGFKSMWKTDDPRSDVWLAVTRVLMMGGQQLSDSQFTAPYVFAFWPDSLDAFEHVAVTGDTVRVLEAPTADARVLGAASNSILRFVEWRGMPESGVAADTTWAQVHMPNGATGWMRGASVYNPVSWRAMFVRRGDRWQMLLFIAGD